jgi:hypothetical protein
VTLGLVEVCLFFFAESHDFINYLFIQIGVGAAIYTFLVNIQVGAFWVGVWCVVSGILGLVCARRY